MDEYDVPFRIGCLTVFHNIEKTHWIKFNDIEDAARIMYIAAT